MGIILRVGLVFSVILLLCFGCLQKEINPFIKNYQKLIVKYNTGREREKGYNSESEKKVYEKYARLPDKVYKLPFKHELVKAFKAGKENSLPKYCNMQQPDIPSYPELYKVENGKLYFMFLQCTGGIDNYEYDIKNNLLQTGEESIVWSMSIWSDAGYGFLTYDREKDIIVQSDEPTNVIIDYKRLNPSFSNCIFFSPIKQDDLAYFVGSYDIEYKYGFKDGDTFFYIYNWREMQTKEIVILPAFSYYLGFRLSFGPINSMDKKNRLYTAITISNLQGLPYPEGRPIDARRTGSIMIYDIYNNVLYDLRHQFLLNEYEDQPIYDTIYVLGEDENIYYEIVAKDMYLIYRVTPLWDEKMEEIEYNPVFFEYAPKALQKEWERLKTEIKKE